jgi:hypothetical protein
MNMNYINFVNFNIFGDYMNTFYKYSLVLLLFVISSCSSPNSGPNEDSLQIMPLEEGKAWIYSTNQKIYTSSDTSFKYDTIGFGLNRKRRVDNEDLYELVTRFDNHTDQFYINRSNGLWGVRYYSYDSSYGDLTYIYKYPTKVGDFWYESYHPSSAQITTVAVDKKITVPAGTYSCVCYKIYYPSERKTLYNCLSPGVGLIMQKILKDSTNFNDTNDITFKLVKIQKNPIK